MKPLFRDHHNYRWVVVAAASFVLAVVMGQLVNGLSAFFVPLEAEFGWSRGDIALINSLGLAGIGLGGIIMGVAADRLNVQAVIIAGTLATGLTFIAASLASSLTQLYVLVFLAGALGGGAVFAPLFTLIGAWFRAGAGLAIGIASAGQALGQGGIPLANSVLIESFGWRGAMLGYGAFVLAATVPLALLLRPAPAVQNRLVDAIALEAPILPLWAVISTLSMAVLFCCGLMSVPLMHLVPLLQGCGFPATEAGSAVLAMTAAAVAGRVAFGKLCDTIGAIPAYFAASAWQTALVFLFTRTGDLTFIYLFALVYGFGYGGVMTGVLSAIRHLAPARARSSATGIVMAFAWFGHGLGGYVGALLFDWTGTYDLAFAAATLAGTINLVMVGWLFILGVYRMKQGIIHAVAKFLEMPSRV